MQFIDSSGRVWPITIDFPDISRIKREADVDLLTDAGMARVSQLKTIEDYELLANVLYIVCSDQADRYGVTDEQFGRLASQQFADIMRAFNGALADFFRRVGRGPMARMIETAMTMQTTQEARLNDALPQTTLERLLNKSTSITLLQLESEVSQSESEMDAILGGESTSLPHSAESATPSSDEA
jgi:hypothetical protein